MDKERRRKGAGYERYRDVEALDSSLLWDLLREGDAPERVWAVWALAIKEEQQALPGLRPLLRNEPDSGVRRHLLNVFAGHGDLDAVAHVACWDSAPWVREAALMFLCRVAPKQGEPVWRLLADRLVCEPDGRVACATVAALPAGWPPVVQARLETLAERPAQRLRLAACRRLGLVTQLAAARPRERTPAPEGDDWRRYLPVPWRAALPDRRPSSVSLWSANGGEAD